MVLSLLLALAIPVHTGYLTTYDASVLTPLQRETLNTTLRDYEQLTTNQFVILIVPSLEGESIEPFANRVFHAWGIGDKIKDNGVLLVWATGERKVRLEVGYGLEAKLTDGRAGQIIREAITPHFRDREWYTGLTNGVNAVIAQLDTVGAVPLASVPDKPFDLLPFLIFGAIGLVISVFAIIVHHRRKREQEKRERAEYRALMETPLNHDYTTTFIQPAPYTPSTRRSYTAPSYRGSDYSSSSSSSGSSYDSGSSSSGSDFSGGGGDSGGGGASGDY